MFGFLGWVGEIDNKLDHLVSIICLHSVIKFRDFKKKTHVTPIRKIT